ncbi:uncharacterized protein [Gossypium hirsutum]|uniref:Uncharacterized protein n=1 Tax=Gossypium hirsutum TaxID=3635 RepID=A0ABM2Z5K3_GOSHI|nr:uncharacterized protein LOC121210003 [Gossypium hirsutum]
MDRAASTEETKINGKCTVDGEAADSKEEDLTGANLADDKGDDFLDWFFTYNSVESGVMHMRNGSPNKVIADLLNNFGFLSFVQITVELGLDFSSRMDLESVDSVSQPPVKASDIETPAEAYGVKVPASTDGIKHNDKANEVEPPVRTNDVKSPIETCDVEAPKAGDNAPTDISSWGRKFKFPTLIPPP